MTSASLGSRDLAPALLPTAISRQLRVAGTAHKSL